MKTIRGKSIQEWKANAEEDYLNTPISVLKYITILEETYASQFRQEWVSVEERLPEIKYHIDYRCSDNVLAWCEGYLRVMAYCVVDGERVWCDCGFDLQGDPLHNDDYIVTHWQPLPDPPSQP